MRTIVTFAIGAAAGCGGPSTDLEGIYTVDAWTENTASCAAAGPDIRASHDPMFFIRMDSFGQSFLNVVDCPTQTECATLAADRDMLQLGMFILPEGNDDDGWTGKFIFAFSGPTAGTCSGEVQHQLLTRDGDTAVTVRVEHVDVASFPESGGTCETEGAEAAAQSLPCTSLELVHATFTAAF